MRALLLEDALVQTGFVVEPHSEFAKREPDPTERRDLDATSAGETVQGKERISKHLWKHRSTYEHSVLPKHLEDVFFAISPRCVLSPC